MACAKLANAFGGDTVFPWNADYTPLRTAHWSETVWEYPGCIFVPETPKDLQKGLPIITKEKARFAIRSGGHNPALGAAATEGGVLVDLSNFDTLSYDASKNLAQLGVGRRWGEVYDYLDQYQVTVVGGRVLDVGVGGLVLGSGLSYLSDMYGMACDNVVDFEVILADGTLTNANKSKNADLFYALKGGSNNFAVVTKYTVNTYPIHNIWGGTRIIPFDYVNQVLDAVLTYQSDPNRDPYASMNLNIAASNQTDLGIVLTLMYLKPEANPAVFAPFDAIPSVLDTVSFKTLTQAMGEFPTPPIPRIRFLASSFKPSKALHDFTVKLMTTSPLMQTIKSATAGSAIWSWQAIPPRLVQQGVARGGNALGLQPVHQSWFHIDLLWWDKKDDDKVSKAGHALMAQVVAEAKRLGVFLDYIFMNDASETQDVISSYGSANKKKLRDVSKRVDPQQAFQNLAAGAWKLYE